MFACEFRDRVQMKSLMKVENQAGDEAKGNDEITGHEAEITLAEHNENIDSSQVWCAVVGRQGY